MRDTPPPPPSLLAADKKKTSTEKKRARPKAAADYYVQTCILLCQAVDPSMRGEGIFCAWSIGKW